jgi:hypothetical protein
MTQSASYARKRLHEDKQKMLHFNLPEAKFKESHLGCRIGFSKFTFLQPRNCVLSRSKWNLFCQLCAADQNVNLMLEGCSWMN